MKYRLYSSHSAWTSRNTSLETHLDIPNGAGTERYAVPFQIPNSESSDYEKYVMPVVTAGMWKCDDQFLASDLVNYDPDWYPPDVE